MSIVRFSVTVLVIIALFSCGLSAGGFENFPVGIQAKGMSGAFRAVADDWTAAYYNPAGYAFIQDNQLGATTGLIHLRNEIIPNYRLDGVYEVGFYNDVTNYNKHEIYSNPAAGFVARLPIMGETVIGFSVYQPFDYNITWQMYDLPSAYNDVLFMPGDQFSTNLDVVAFQLTLARELVEEKVSAGLGLQVLRGDLIFSDVIFRENPYLDVPLSDLADRPRDKITEFNKNDGRGFGFGINAGLMVKLNDKLNLGITGHLPFDITISGTSRLEYFMPLNPTVAISEGYTVMDPEYCFISGGLIADSADFETKLKLPASVGIGVAYSVTENLTVALDGAYTLWSRFDGFNFLFTNHTVSGLNAAADTISTYQAFFTENVSSPVEWKDAGKVALGLRYNLKDLFTFLAGTSMDQSPAKDAVEFTPHFVDTGTKYGYSAGMVWHRNQWDFGIAGSITTYPDLTVENLVDSDDDGLPDNFTGEYKASTYETVLSFNYRF